MIQEIMGMNISTHNLPLFNYFGGFGIFNALRFF